MMSDSSSSTKKVVRNCPNCKTRMSGRELDPHVICIDCRGKDCNGETRCDICVSWSDQQMGQYLKHQASLKRKRESKLKSKSKLQHPVDLATLCTGLPDVDVLLPDDGVSGDGAASVSSVAGSASAVHFSNLLDDRIQRVESNMDNKLQSFGINMLEVMNDRFESIRSDLLQITSSFPAPNQVRGQPLDKRPSDPDPDLLHGSDSLGVREEGPVPGRPLPSSPVLSAEAASTLANIESLLERGILSQQGYQEARDKVLADVEAPAREPVRPSPSGFGGGVPLGPGPSRPDSGVGAGGLSPRPSELDTEGQEPTSAQFLELFNLVLSFYPHARAEPDRLPPDPFLIEMPPSGAQSGFRRFRLYERLERIKEDVVDKVKNVARDSKKPSSVLPRRRVCYRLPSSDASITPPLNDGFNRLTKVKATNNSSITIPIEEFRRMETALAGLQEAQSFSFWLVNTLCAYVREGGFVAPDEAIYHRLVNSLSLSLMDQAKASFGLSAFCNLSRRAHFLRFAQPTVTEGQRARLSGASPFIDRLFDEDTLKEVISEFEGAAATTSHLELAKAVTKGLFFGKRKLEESQAGVGSPLVPPNAAVPSTSKANVAAMFTPKYGRGRGQKKGGRGNYRGGRGGGSAAAQKPPGQDLSK